jgi:hypothetical protein
MALHEEIKQSVAAASDPEKLPPKSDDKPPTPVRTVRRFFVALIGFTVLLLGILMIVLPGPALVVIPAGLAILATEFIWARRALRRCKGVVVSVQRKPWFRRFRRWRKPGRNAS